MNLELVECNVCHGVGKLFRDDEHWKYCPRCFGAGKLDWIEVVVGKRPPKLKDGWTINYQNMKLNSLLLFKDEQEIIINDLSDQICEDIDEQIMKELSEK